MKVYLGGRKKRGGRGGVEKGGGGGCCNTATYSTRGGREGDGKGGVFGMKGGGMKDEGLFGRGGKRVAGAEAWKKAERAFAVIQ